jgi:hypothetical protein
MIFPWILMLFINGDPLPWAGFQDEASCESVRRAMAPAPGVKSLCARTTSASQ